MSEVILSREGLRARSAPLWLDATRKTACSFVSHAHGDHIGRHLEAIGTPATLALMGHRLQGAKTVHRQVEYGRSFRIGPLELELFSAGHVLGSAQIRITVRGHRTVYTGDLNTAPSRTAAAVEVAACDTLVIESTFGHPRYRFPPRSEVEDRIAAFAGEVLDAGVTPVFFAYSLGKSQEAVKILGERGFKVRVHPEAWAICEIYSAHGVRFPNAAPLSPEAEAGEVIVAPPRTREFRAWNRRGPIRTCFLSGWAIDPGARYRSRVDAAIPLSDHADFDGLVDYAKATGASRVLTTHGSADDLARELRARGVDARAMNPSPQLELF
ncbi:MBL fold metallo-hydrolase [Vulgatibacter incomptus]|uniref:mRNA 3-end processing exonuclease n=1 Tax=Vulgatibacter incomptus TaxID=1391653 RepID=A0A0K1PDB2_9BACT|nr:MBL fold metallo-hydrolase [Vulgatibacter incomptus]AKU91510.1 mRNA 3-end processing exonuclease [Vulgatibacter incomptus]